VPKGVYPRKSPEERYLAKLDTSGGPDACWPWTASRSPRGYGKFSVDGRAWRAHRWGYEHFVGPIPEGHGVLHTCDDPPCQNPAHWFTGTDADNNHDMIAKNRARYLTGDNHPARRHPERISRGERHYAAKLSDNQVAELRQLWATGRYLQRELALRFGIRQSHVSRLIHHAARHLAASLDQHEQTF
jgi:hypothetical protein